MILHPVMTPESIHCAPVSVKWYDCCSGLMLLKTTDLFNIKGTTLPHYTESAHAPLCSLANHHHAITIISIFFTDIA